MFDERKKLSDLSNPKVLEVDNTPRVAGETRGEDGNGMGNLSAPARFGIALVYECKDGSTFVGNFFNFFDHFTSQRQQRSGMAKKRSDDGKKRETALEKKKREGFERVASGMGLTSKGEDPDAVHAQLMKTMRKHCSGGYPSNNIKGLNFPLLGHSNYGKTYVKKKSEEIDRFVRRRGVPSGTELPVPLQIPRQCRINVERHIETLRAGLTGGKSAEEAAYAASRLEMGLEGFDLRPEDLAARSSYYKFPNEPGECEGGVRAGGGGGESFAK